MWTYLLYFENLRFNSLSYCPYYPLLEIKFSRIRHFYVINLYLLRCSILLLYKNTISNAISRTSKLNPEDPQNVNILRQQLSTIPKKKTIIVSYACFNRAMKSSVRWIGHGIESANKRLKGLRLRVLGRCALQNAATVSMDIGYGRWGGRASCTSSYGVAKLSQ